MTDYNLTATVTSTGTLGGAANPSNVKDGNDATAATTASGAFTPGTYLLAFISDLGASQACTASTLLANQDTFTSRYTWTVYYSLTGTGGPWISLDSDTIVNDVREVFRFTSTTARYWKIEASITVGAETGPAQSFYTWEVLDSLPEPGIW